MVGKQKSVPVGSVETIHSPPRPQLEHEVDDDKQDGVEQKHHVVCQDGVRIS